MKSKVLYIVLGTAAALLLLNSSNIETWYHLISGYLNEFEKFSAKPYWDVKRWSWGYGTRVPGSIDNKNNVPTGTITRLQAAKDAYDHIKNDYNYLSSLIKIPLTARQWAAFLSFSYNLGPGNADNLIDNINERRWDELNTQWLQYNKADGEYKQYLAERRKFEISEFLEDI